MLKRFCDLCDAELVERNQPITERSLVYVEYRDLVEGAKPHITEKLEVSIGVERVDGKELDLCIQCFIRLAHTLLNQNIEKFQRYAPHD